MTNSCTLDATIHEIVNSVFKKKENIDQLIWVSYFQGCWIIIRGPRRPCLYRVRSYAGGKNGQIS